MRDVGQMRHFFVPIRKTGKSDRYTFNPDEDAFRPEEGNLAWLIKNGDFLVL